MSETANEYQPPKGRPGRLGGNRRPSLPDWRGYLSPTERVDLQTLEINAASLDERRRKITHEITTLRHRGSARRRLALAKKGLESA